MSIAHRSRPPHRAAAGAAILYLVLASVWILASDRLVEWVATSPADITALQTLKGSSFVLVTAIALYVIVRRELSVSQRSEARLKVLAGQSLAGVFILEDGRIADVNRRLLEMLGYSRKEDLIKADLMQLIHPDEIEVVQQLAGLGGEDEPTEKRFRIRVFRRSGELMYADVVAGRVELEGVSTTMGLVFDSTEQVQLEEQFRRAQKIHTLGQLTGAIAHDFNNLLTAILGPLELSIETLRDDHPARDDLLLARTTTQRAASLSRQLLTFSRKRVSRQRVFDLNRPVGELRPLVEQLVGEAIDTTIDLMNDVLPVILDESQLEQVLLNLVVNAVDAMPRGGHLTIRTYRFPASPETIRHRDGLRPGPHAVLEVSDTGAGIPESVRLQIFEPFFSTKPKGTGLGLSTVFGIVDQAGGFIRVKSELERGTTFLVFLPQSDRPLDPEEPPPPEPERSALGGGAVLVVEDEESVRQVLGRMLERSGYEVLPAEDGPMALKIWKEQHERCRLLITDLMLPGMNGIELAEDLRRDRPDLPVLFTSGYSERELTNRIGEVPNIRFLEKPFTMRELQEKVREALGSPA